MRRHLLVTALASTLCVFSAQGQPSKPCDTAGRVHVESFDSEILHSSQTIRVLLPPGYSDPANAQRRYPVLYMFDGQWLFGHCADPAAGSWEIDLTLPRLIAEGKVQPLIVVAIDTPTDPAKRGSMLLEEYDRALPFRFDPHGDRLPAFFQDELVPRIAAAYRVKTGRDFTAVGGASYGAVAATDLLTEAPMLFGLGLIESPSCTPGNGALARRTQSLAIAPERAYIGVGSHETASMRAYIQSVGYSSFAIDGIDRSFVRNAKTVAANFQAASSPAQVKFVEDPQGIHNEATWRRRFTAAIEFLFPSQPTP